VRVELERECEMKYMTALLAALSNACWVCDRYFRPGRKMEKAGLGYVNYLSGNSKCRFVRMMEKAEQ